MMAVKRITFVTKPEQMPKLASGPIHIILRPNLRVRDKKKGTRNEKIKHLTKSLFKLEWKYKGDEK